MIRILSRLLCAMHIHALELDDYAQRDMRLGLPIMLRYRCARCGRVSYRGWR